MIDLKKILYPSDFSEHSLCALPYARELSGRFGAELHCLHVVDEATQYWVGTGDTAVPIVVPLEELTGTAEKQMAQFVADNFGEDGAGIVSHVVSGRPFIEIIHYAQEQEIDLIVIATHGHGALASMLMGSVTEKVVRKCPCPVLTVRHKEHKFEMP